MQNVSATQDSTGARPAMLDALRDILRQDILRPVAAILVAGAGVSAGVWWVAELGRFWA